MKILFQERRKVDETAIIGYFASRGVTYDPSKVQLIDIDKVDITSCDCDYYVVSGYECYAKLTTLAHMGFRKAPDWTHIKMLKVIRLSNGAELIIADGSLEDLYEKLDMLLTGNTPMSHKPLTNNIVLTDPDAIIDTIRYIRATYKPDELTGFDYETTGLYDSSDVDNKNFRATGVSISIQDYGWFFDFRFLGNRKEDVMTEFRGFCTDFQQSTYAFNATFEYMTTVFEAGVACEFSDLRHYWVQDGNHQDWASFKYIARYYLHVPSWDDAFETMSDVFGAFYSLVDRHEGSWEAFLEFLKRWTPATPMTNYDLRIDSDQLLVIERDNINEPKTIDDMNLILSQFTEEDMTEFRYLCNSPIWNVSGFGIIPSRFLGHYCNLDAYYTKECVLVNQGKYSQLCDDVYRDNARFGMTINSTGVVKDLEAYDDNWRVLNQKLSHEAYVLTLHAMRKKVEDIEMGKRVSNVLIKGFPKYNTLAPTEVLNGGKSPKKGKWPNHPSQYSIIGFEGLGLVDHDDAMYTIVKWVSDWTNPYEIVRGLFKRIIDWEILSGKKYDGKAEVFPDWVNDEYHYWGVIKFTNKIFQDRDKYPIVDTIIAGDWKTFDEKYSDYRFLIHDIAKATIDMVLNYNFNKIKDACAEWYELKTEVTPAKYYNTLAQPQEPIYLRPVSVPDNAPGFIYDIMKQGYGMDNIYYYAKDMILRLVNPAFERNYDENLAWTLFNNYEPIDPKYKTFKDEVDDWLFWKDKELSESVAKRISVVRGLAKVFERVIKETVGDLNQEEFAMTAELISAKKLIKDLQDIPEFKSAKRHDDLPDVLHFDDREVTLYDFQILMLRNTLGLTGPQSYDEFMNRYLDDYMQENKFSLFIGQYADIYDRYMKVTDVSNMNWLDKYVTEYKEFDLSKVFVIDDKDLTQRTDLSRVKILLANEFKNLLARAMQVHQAVTADHSKLQELLDMAKVIGDEIPKFQFMVVDHGDELQVMVYDAKQADGKFRVAHQKYDENEATVEDLLNEFNVLVTRSFDMVRNIVQYDSLTPEQQADFMQPYGSLINSLVAPVFNMYTSKLGITITDYNHLMQVCNDMLTDTDKSWVVNERLNMTDWLVRHMYTVSYLTDRYGDEFTDNFVDYLDSMDVDMSHPLYPYKIMFMQRMFKKDNKALTYLTGMLRDYDTYYDEIDEFTMLGTRWSEDPSKAKWVKMMAPWGCNALASKRWNGPLQTLAKGAEYRRICGTPDNKFLTYYDISQAEPRTSAYMSGDKNMIWYFETNTDLYIACGELFIGRPALDWEERMYLRSLFKSILLGIIYKMGPATLAANTGLTVENAKRGIAILEEQFPDLTAWATSNAQFCIENNGEIRTVLGDKLRAQGGDESRYNSQGANQPVQNFSSVVLVYGFYNVIRQAIAAGYSIRPELVVHDASINISDIKLFPVVFPFYKKHFQDFLKEKVGIVFKYDLEVMANYMDVCFIKNISVEGEPDHYELKGTNRALNLMLRKFELNDMEIEILEQKRDFEEEYIMRYKDSLLNQGETFIHKDHSSNKIVFRFLKTPEEILATRTMPAIIK